MIIWSIKLQFQSNFLLTSYKTKQFWKKVRCFLIQPEFYLNSCLVCTADCLLFAICHEQTSGNYDAALACRSDSVVELFPVHLQTVLNLFTVQTAISGLQTKHFWVFTRRREYVNTHFRKVPKFSGLIRKENTVW